MFGGLGVLLFLSFSLLISDSANKAAIRGGVGGLGAMVKSAKIANRVAIYFPLSPLVKLGKGAKTARVAQTGASPGPPEPLLSCVEPAISHPLAPGSSWLGAVAVGSEIRHLPST
jgi:hypothetical protein